jgi:pilus assembly protein CpaB
VLTGALFWWPGSRRPTNFTTGGVMQGRNLILLGVAVLIGLIAVFLANTYFSGVEEKQQRVAEQQKLVRVVVAGQDLAFGTPLAQQNLRLANWPANSVPVGAFTSIETAMRGGRVALRPIVIGEPVLASKVSGADGRATLSANLPVGKLAFAVPINDVSGVGGFARPGDRVDVLLTRPIPGSSTASTDKMTDVILEAVPVLGIDQVSDESQTKPTVSKTATLEVDSLGAQKLALAIQLGTLSLALRNVADLDVVPPPTVIPRHLTVSNYHISSPSSQRSAPLIPAAFRAIANKAFGGAPGSLTIPMRPKGPTMTVFRGSLPSEYEVQRGW